jgi:hypothetical protein
VGSSRRHFPYLRRKGNKIRALAPRRDVRSTPKGRRRFSSRLRSDGGRREVFPGEGTDWHRLLPISVTVWEIGARRAALGRALRLLLRLLMIDVGGRRAGRDLDVPIRPSEALHVLHRGEGASEPVAAKSRAPWTPRERERSHALCRGEAPHGISDHASRTARALAGSLGWSMAGLWNSRHFRSIRPRCSPSAPNTRARSRRTAGPHGPRATSAPDGAASLSRAVAGPDTRGGARTSSSQKRCRTGAR